MVKFGALGNGCTCTNRPVHLPNNTAYRKATCSANSLFLFLLLVPVPSIFYQTAIKHVNMVLPFLSFFFLSQIVILKKYNLHKLYFNISLCVLFLYIIYIYIQERDREIERGKERYKRLVKLVYSHICQLIQECLTQSTLLF